METTTLKGFTITWPDDAVDDEAKRRAAATYAVDSLMALTLHRVGGSLVTVTPRTACQHTIPLGGLPTPAFIPYRGVDGGVYNCACATGCGCPSWPSVTLPPPVGRIESVMVDGEVLPESAYRLADGNVLMRLDGGTWPACADDFIVTYLNAFPVDEVGNMAASILALEFLNALTGSKKCRLPSNVTGLTRQGVTMELTTGLFPAGMTGIREVDAFIHAWNPNTLTIAPTVHSPDYGSRPRRHAWGMR